MVIPGRLIFLKSNSGYHVFDSDYTGILLVKRIKWGKKGKKKDTLAITTTQSCYIIVILAMPKLSQVGG